ncbi:MAG: RNA 2',3'-cyclic phosphodiesterase [Candidatus Dormibacteraeota bacterium]|nr:RNA 2',3'-cyclic phosphodiesterase [Candidatus Dormibacteraeota bacterium]
MDSSMGGSEEGDRVRAFLALTLPEEQRRVLAAHVEECARRAPGHRWVPPANLHLTLRFLGSLERSRLERLRQGLRSVRLAAFELGLDGRGSFGPRAAPRVVWLGVGAGREHCAALAESVEEACAAVGLESEARPFRAHVTLARARSGPSRLPELPAPPTLEPWTVADFVLYESRLGAPAATYLELERYGLEGQDDRAP